MQVERNKVVAFEYKVSDDEGQLIDSSSGEEPLLYLHGFGNIIPGLEEALEGRQAGDEFSVSLTPEQAYGSRNDELIQTVDRKDFEDPDELEVGMQFQTPEEDGGLMFVIAEINGDEVVIDANHMLAGMNVHLDIKVGDIRDATPEEIEHEHAHYPDDELDHC